MDLIHLGMLGLGLGLTCWNTWQHRGRSRRARAWAPREAEATREREGAARRVLVLWPLLAALLLLGAALGPAAASTAGEVALGLAFLVLLVLWLLYAALPLPIPRAVQPRWFRELGGIRRPGGSAGG